MGTLSDIEADWPRISALLDEAMSRAAAEREAFIDALTAPDDCFRDTLRELLALQAKAETEDFMEALPVIPGLLTGPWPHEAGAGTASAGALAAGTEVGPYRLLRPIGEGGMGAVWLAERADGTLKRKVALKLPRLAWASDLAARMARERDILSALEHPNIARLYDAGVDAVGRPWLAIEYVEGRDLAAFCDTARLDLRARVRLFLQVLSAVQYAHGSLVIHRDLKPANILVTPQGEARLLDFGIARLEEGAADAGPTLTREGANAMTPRYASPEQVQGKRLTVASDIYSLGVVLHELLTGETPYTLRRGTRAEYEQAIVESDLRVPSRTTVSAEAAAARSSTPQTLTRMLRGDGDAMLMRALAPAPEGRYASAAALRDDLERWLEGRPVSAVPPSRTYALRKFVARNRLAVAASAAAALALVAVSVVAVLQAQRAERSAAEARAEAARANATKEFLISTYAGADPTLRGGRDATAKELLAEAEKQLETKLKDQLELQAEVLRTVDNIWDRLGDVERSRLAARRRTEVLLAAGDRAGALDSLLSEAEAAMKFGDNADVSKTLARIDRLPEASEMSRVERARYLYLQGNLLGERGERGAALEKIDESISIARGAGDPHTLFLGMLSRIYLRRAGAPLAEFERDVAEAESLLQSLDLAPVDVLSRRLQLAVARYLIGDYLGGWPEMARIVVEADRLYGAGNPASFDERSYWLRYCLRLGKADLAADWLRSLESGGERSVLPEFARRPSWHLLVARVYMALGEWRRVDSHINSAESLAGLRGGPGEAGTDAERWKLRIENARVESSLRRGGGISAAGFTDPASIGGGAVMSTDESYQRWWLQGLAARAGGDPVQAVVALRRAEAETIQLFGPPHPEVALVRLDLALAAADNRSGVSDAEIASLVRSAAPALRASLPMSHPAAGLVAELTPLLAEDSPLRQSRVRQRLAAIPRAVFFL
jgi:serine/threonine-protein kinase